ncbi:Putative TCP-1/cpn60 chaperonin family protein [Giardia duodenalis]|uniref:T-complex protein 1 subunit gamma n=1 Tax=Giardia intestinalis TaxID=5741 RepID=V6TKY9_GIAIN|nr:Putative TCP-1/cpn60 chaperonin family protein [Giardia intestinalis]
MQPQVYVLSQGTESERREMARMNNIKASKTVADVIRTTMGPRSMLKMILDSMGSVVMTNDGNAILRELDVAHPAAKAMLEVSRAQEEQVGDGTTSVVILAGEVIAMAEPLLKCGIHPILITQGYQKALDFLLSEAERSSFEINIKGIEILGLKSEAAGSIMTVLKNSLSTKFVSRWMDLMCNLALEAVSIVARGRGAEVRKGLAGVTEDAHSKGDEAELGASVDIDIKRFCRIEKIPGATVEDCCVIDGVVLNKDVIHPDMRKYIKNPRILLLDCPLEYKKAQSMMNVELFQGKSDLGDILKVEEDYIRTHVEKILSFKPDLVITEKGVADQATHMFVQHGVTVLRRVRKTDNVRLAAVSGATIVSRVEELQESDVGTYAGLYELQKIGDEFFSFIHQSGGKASACTIVLRGASKSTLLEIERNIQDAMHVCRNIILDPRLVIGGGCFEAHLSTALSQYADTLVGKPQLVIKAVAKSLEVIPRTLLQNCGGNIIRTITELKAAHTSDPNCQLGVDGVTGLLVNCKERGIWDPLGTKLQVLKAAIENACMILRVDDIFSCDGKSV